MPLGALLLTLLVQSDTAALRVTWAPAEPVQGSLVLLELRVPGDSGVAREIHGQLAGEPLHFETDGAGRLIALGGVPLDSAGSVAVEVVVWGERGADTARYAIPVTPRRARRQQLRTAPEFVRPPDSALAARIAADRGLVRHVLAETHERPRLWSLPFLRPRPGRVLSGFGDEREFNAMVESRHRGADLPGRRGAPVSAANRGVVVLVADLYYSGTTVFVDHGAGLVTGYFHLSRATVAQGDTVGRGQVIGRVGASGRVTGPHLHWVAHHGRIAFDPIDLLSLVPPWPAVAPAPVGESPPP